MFPFRRDIIEEHADEAAFLYRQREFAFTSRREDMDSLRFQDERLLAHLDALLVSGDAAWKPVRKGLETDDPGEVFVAAWVGLGHAPTDLPEHLARAVEDPARWEALRAAFRLALRPVCDEGLTRLRDHAAPRLRALALEGLTVWGEQVPTGPVLEALESGDPLCITCGLAAATRLRDPALRDPVRTILRQAAPVLDAVRAGFALGVPDAFPVAKRIAGEDTPQARLALALIACACGEEAGPVLMEATRRPGTSRDAVIALGRLGHPETLTTLVEAVEKPAAARPAGRSLERLLGIGLEENGLTLPEPEEPADTGEADLDLDEDDDLPRPDPQGVRTWWSEHRRRWGTGNRLHAGEVFTFSPVFTEVREGVLPDREAAVLECLYRLPGLPWFETRGWGRDQDQHLDSFMERAEAAAPLALRASKGWPTLATAG